MNTTPDVTQTLHDEFTPFRLQQRLAVLSNVEESCALQAPANADNVESSFTACAYTEEPPSFGADLYNPCADSQLLTSSCYLSGAAGDVNLDYLPFAQRSAMFGMPLLGNTPHQHGTIYLPPPKFSSAFVNSTTPLPSATNATYSTSSFVSQQVNACPLSAPFPSSNTCTGPTSNPEADFAEEVLRCAMRKKLRPEMYENLFQAMLQSPILQQRFVRTEHVVVANISDLAGLIYFIRASRATKKPPRVGFRFRSYSFSHYSSMDRAHPIICKVKEWPATLDGVVGVGGDSSMVWRMYHFYVGNKRHRLRKSKDSPSGYLPSPRKRFKSNSEEEDESPPPSPGANSSGNNSGSESPRRSLPMSSSSSSSSSSTPSPTSPSPTNQQHTVVQPLQIIDSVADDRAFVWPSNTTNFTY